MPDLQSELSKIANAWDTHEQTIRHDSHEQTQEKATAPMKSFTKTGVCSHDVFAYVNANRHIYTPPLVAAALTDMGYRKSSVFALITQMKRNGMLKLDDNGFLTTTQDEYTPFANPYPKYSNPPVKVKNTTPSLKRAKKARTDLEDALTYVRAQVQPQAGLMALQPTKPAPAVLTADSVLASMSVSEAFKLYQELAKMFGV